MLQKLSLPLFIAFLSACSHGPRLDICVSDAQNQFDCNKSSPLPYSESEGFNAYSESSYQKIINFCASRNQAGTQAPSFNSCSSAPLKDGFDCLVETCSFNLQSNGIRCEGYFPYFVSYAQSKNYIALSNSDNQTLMDYCNIKVGQ